MIIDFDKDFFNVDEILHVKKQLSERIYDKINYIPVIVILKSNVLKMEKIKYLFPKDYRIYQMLIVLRKQMQYIDKKDELQVYVMKTGNKIYVEDLNISLDELFKYKNIQLDSLIIYIERQTWSKMFYNLLFSRYSF